ncbi:MAG: ELM1/GtrOC1 family putative glycosyltransferase [Candidatus Omnitrophica bacterium]|nr:ELM1/GtrOC1 family putative glycosyltransferase [Candidatus Omnitrophota bacterium]
MKQNLIADYLSCILFRVLSFFTSFIPLDFSLFLGRRLGDLIYLFDRRHRVIAYANIRKTVADKLDCASSARITRRAYQAFGQNLIEISFIPRINKRYLKKYIQIENEDCIQKAFNRGKGVIFLIVHEGNWELSNIICANLGFPFLLFVRDQGFPKLNALLNSYRLKQGAMIIHKEGGLRQLVEALKSNQAIGMTVDQGGKSGEIVKFFGKEASMSVGAVKLAIKFDCSIIPVFYTRIKGPYTKVILDQVYTATRTNNPESDLRENLQRLINVYEGYIRKYPHEYLWTYKIWKYGLEREILILSDGKTGHLRQSQGLAKLIGQQLANRGIKYNLSIQEVKFHSRLSEFIFNWAPVVCIRCLYHVLTNESWQSLVSFNPDIIISAGGSISRVNYLLVKENYAKSIVLMRPTNISLKKFNLVIIPEHDWPQGHGLASFGQSHRPVKRENVVSTEGALNLIDSDYLKEKSISLEQSNLLKVRLSTPCIGVLIGGNTKKFSIDTHDIIELSGQVKKVSEELNADILISTSRRTSVAVERVLKDEFSTYTRCKLLVIANESNNPDVVGAILGLSNIIICSPESISMISEAVCAEKYVVVFKGRGLSKKHECFLKNYQDKGYIYLNKTNDLADGIKEIWLNKPKINIPQDNLKVAEALNKIL